MDLLKDFERQLEKIMPSISVLNKELNRFKGQIELGEGDLNQVLFSLERVYYIVLTMRELQEFFGDKIQFGGGAVLNYIFMPSVDAPRFTFDLDSAWSERVSNKRVLLSEMIKFNKYLSEKYPLCLPIDEDKCLTLLTVEYDAEKDYFPNVLSLRIPAIMRWSGLEFYRYVKSVSGVDLDLSIINKLRKIFESTIGVRDARVDFIRFEVSMSVNYPRAELDVDLPFELGSSKLFITDLEYQLASKIVYKVGWDFGGDLEFNLHDILKAILDLRLLNIAKKEKVKRYVWDLTGSSDIEWGLIEKNLSELQRSGGKYWTSFHYVLVRGKHRKLDKLVFDIKRKIREVLQQ